MRFARAVNIFATVGAVAWICVAFWNSAKPLPAGTHVVSLSTRIPESDVDFLVDSPRHSAILSQESAAIDRAEQLVVIDQTPLARELALHLLARKHVRPNLKIVLITDPRNEAFGGTRSEYLTSLEQVGAMVARVRLDRLRDSSPLYSGLWRLCAGWWSDPYDEIPGEISLAAWTRTLNFKSDERQLMIADDGSGGWTSIIASAPSQDAAAGTNTALMIRGPIVHDVAASELQIAGWSTDDDRLPAAPQIGARGVGSIDTRFLTEGASAAALVEAVAVTRGNDEIFAAAFNLSDRRFIAAALRAAARGVRLQVLLDPNHLPNQAAAGELTRDGGGHIEVRWYPLAQGSLLAKLLIVRHGSDLWMNLGSANFTRRNLGDLNLTASVELRMPGRSAVAHAVTDYFSKAWSSADSYGAFADESVLNYWHYRFAEASGLSSF